MTAQQAFRNTLVVLLTLVGAYALFVSSRILIVLLVAIIIASAVRTAVLWLERRGLNQGLAILLVYGWVAVSIFVLAVMILPPSVRQLAGYIENDDRLAIRLVNAQAWIETNLERLTQSEITLLDPDSIRATVSDVVRGITDAVPALAGEFGGLLGDFILVFVMGVYWLTSRDQAVNFVQSLFSMGRRAQVAQIIEEIESSLGNYVRGVAQVVMFVFIANLIILLIFGVPNAVTLAFIIGITTALPVLGGFIGAGTAVLLALLSSPVHALITFGSFVAVQQVEVHYLTPRALAKSVGLQPLLIIVIIFVGFALGGVVGGLISVPVAGTVFILLRHLIIEPRKELAAPHMVEGGILLHPRDVRESGRDRDAIAPTGEPPAATGPTILKP